MKIVTDREEFDNGKKKACKQEIQMEIANRARYDSQGGARPNFATVFFYAGGNWPSCMITTPCLLARLGREGVMRVEQLLQLAKDYWPVALLIIVVIMAAQWMVRSLVRIISLLVVVGVVLVLFFQFSPEEVIQMGRQAVQATQEVVDKTIKPVLDAELKNADIAFQPDGSYEVKTASIRIVGKKGESKATVYYKDDKWEVDIGQLGKLFEERLDKAEQQNAAL